MNTGSFDPAEAIVPRARARGAWVHVDGAFGLWARAAPGLASLARGLEEADSWATDLHKWLNVPYDSGLALVRDGAALRESMSMTVAYLPRGEAARSGRGRTRCAPASARGRPPRADVERSLEAMLRAARDAG